MYVKQLSGANLGALPCGSSKTFVMSPNGTFASPCSFEFLGDFQGLQRSINEYIAKFLPDRAQLTVDGDIGPTTLAAARAVWEDGNSEGTDGTVPWVATPPASAKDLASRSTAFMASFASAAGAQEDSTPVAASAAQKVVIDSTGKVVPIENTKKSASMGGPIILAAFAGLAVYSLGRKRKLGKR